MAAPVDFGALGQGLLQGYQLGSNIRSNKTMAEMAKFQKQFEEYKRLSEELSDSKKSEAYKKTLIPAWNELGKQIYSKWGLTAPQHDGLFESEDKKNLQELNKVLNDAMMVGAQDPNKAGQLLGAWANNATANMDKDTASKFYQNMAGLLTGKVSENKPIQMGLGTTILPDQMFDLAEAAKASVSDPNTRKMIDDALKSEQEKHAKYLMGSRAGLIPEQQEELQREALTSKYSDIGTASKIAQIETQSQRADYKTQEPKHRDADTGEYVVWDPNTSNPVTGSKGVYRGLDTGDIKTKDQLIPIELKYAPTPILKTADFNKSAMQRLEKMAKYYKPEYVGIVQGRIANPERKLTELPPEQVKFYREFKQFNDDVVRAKEGAVVPEAMMARLEQFLNDIKQPSTNFEAQFDSLTDYVRDQIKNQDESIQGQYISPYKKQHREFYTNEGRSLLKKQQAKPVSSGKSVVRVERNKKTGQTRYTYSDGTQEIK